MLSVIQQIEVIDIKMQFDDVNILVEIILFIALQKTEYLYQTINNEINICVTFEFDDDEGDEIVCDDEVDDETCKIELYNIYEIFV